MLHPKPGNVDIVVLNRNFFKEPESHDIDLVQLTSSLHIRFLSNTRWLEDSLRAGRKLDLHSYQSKEILPPASGGVIILGGLSQSAKSVDLRVVGQLASLLRDEKRLVGSKWKVIAPLATLTACGGILEGLDGVSVEVLKTQGKGGTLDFLLGLREAHAAGYRHMLLLVNEIDKDKYKNSGELQKYEKVVAVVDNFGLITFSQTLHAQRKANQPAVRP